MSFPFPDAIDTLPGHPRGAPPRRPAEGRGRAAAISAMLDELTREWPDDASLPQPLTDQLVRSLDGSPLSGIDAALPIDDLRRVRQSLLQAVLDEAPLDIGKAHAALFDAEWWNRDQAEASSRATTAFRGLLDHIDELLDRAGQRDRKGLALGRFFAEAMASTGPDRPFTVRLDEIFLARHAGTDRATRLRAGLQLAALPRLRVLHAAGVIGGVRIAAAAIPEEARTIDRTPLPDGGYAFSPEAASSALAGYYFDPRVGAEGVEQLTDGALLSALSKPWQELLDMTNAVVPADGSPLLDLVDRMDDFGESMLTRMEGLEQRSAPERAAIMSSEAWHTLRVEAQQLVAEVRADATNDEGALQAAEMLDGLMSPLHDPATWPWLQRSALGMTGQPPVTESAPLNSLALLAPGMSQTLDRTSGRGELQASDGGKLTWRVEPLRDATDPVARARQDMALRELDALFTRRYWDGTDVFNAAWPQHVTYIDGALILDDGKVEILMATDETTAVTAGPPLGEASHLPTTMPGKADGTEPSGDAVSRGQGSALRATRWSPDPTGALTFEQRFTAIAAAFDVETAHWGLSPANIDQLRASLLPDLIQEVAATWPDRPDGVRRAAATHVLEALLTGSALHLRAAGLALLDDPASSGGTAARDPQVALRDLARMQQLTWDRVAKANPLHEAATSQAVLDLFMATTAATPDRPFRLNHDALPFHQWEHRSRSKDAAIGVRLNLFHLLKRLGDAGLTGPAVWVSATSHADGRWTPSGSVFELTGGTTMPRVAWRFDPKSGMLPLRTPTEVAVAPLPIDDERPLRVLAALAPDLEQTLNREARTLRFTWTAGDVRGHAILRLAGVIAGDTAMMDSRLRQLDLLVTAHVARPGAPDLNALPARLTLSANSLSDDSRDIAARDSSGWAFGRPRQSVPPINAAWSSPTERAGSVEVITAFLRDATVEWPRFPPYELWQTRLVDEFGDRPYQGGAGRNDPGSRMRVVAQTFLDGILDVSVSTLRRAHALMLDAAAPGTNPADNHRHAAEIMRGMLDHATAFLKERSGGRVFQDSAPGRALADLYIRLLASSVDGEPLVLAFEPLRDALAPPDTEDPMVHRRTGLLLSLRDQLRLMSRTGVIGKIVFDAQDHPVDDKSPGWTQQDRRWRTEADLLGDRRARWVVDPESGDIRSLDVHEDLLKPWNRLADEMHSTLHDTGEDSAALKLLSERAESIADELKTLRHKPPADRAEGMSARAWDRRIADILALRNQIAQRPLRRSVQLFAQKMLTVAREAAMVAGTSRLQAAFGRGTLTAIDENAPLPLLRRIAPGVSQRLDRAAGVVHLGEGSATRTWALRVPAQGEVAQRWQLDTALRELDILAVRRFAQRDPVDIGALPTGMTYEGGALRSDSGGLLTRLPDVPPVATIGATLPLDVGTSTNTGARHSTSTDATSTEQAGTSERATPSPTAGGSGQVDTSPQASSTHAMDVLIAGWLDKQLGIKHQNKTSAVSLRGFSARISEEAERLGLAKKELAAALNRRSESSRSALDLLALDRRLRELAPGQKWTRSDTVALLDSIYGPRGNPSTSGSAQAIRARFLFQILASRETRRPLDIDFDSLKAWHEDKSNGAVAAAVQDIVDSTPVLDALVKRGVIGALRVVARAPESLTRGDWHQRDDHHVSTTPLPDLLGDHAASPPLRLSDASDALPGLAAIATLLYPPPHRLSQVHAKVGGWGRGDKSLIRMVLRREGKDRNLTFKPRNTGETAESALDIDVAIAHLIGEGSTARRLPMSLRWESESALGLYQERIGTASPNLLATVMARHANGLLVPDDAVIERYRRFADDAGPGPGLLDRPLAEWHHKLTAPGQDVPALVDLRNRIFSPPEKRARRELGLIVLQLDDSPQAFEASLRHVDDARHGGQVLWLQADRHNASQILYGADLTPTVPGQKVKLVLVGQGSTVIGASRALSGYDGTALARRVNQVLDQRFQANRPTADKVTMLGCDLASGFQHETLVDRFRKAFQPLEAYTLVAYRGQVLFPPSERITNNSLNDGSCPTARTRRPITRRARCL